MSSLNGETRQVIRSRPGSGHKHVALLGGERTKIGPPQSHVEGQIPAKFEVILDKQAPDGLAVVLSERRREPSTGIEATPFAMRRIVKEVPQVEELVVGHAATGAVVQVKEACEISAKLDGVASINLRGHILEGVSPLIQDAADIRSKRTQIDAADFADTVRGKPNRRLRVGIDFIPAPSGGIHASFVDQRGREGMVPDRRVRFIDLRMMEKVVGTRRTVKKAGRLRNVVYGKVDVIPGCDIRIKAAIVLGLRKGARTGGYVVGNVGHVAQTAAKAGILRTKPAGILRTQSCRQGRADVQALAWNRSAVYTLRQACIGAGGIIDSRADDTGTREGEILRGDASGRGQGGKRRSLVPSIGNVGLGLGTP